ncbi:type III secretion protein J [Roseateles sp. YR242]|uniref:type III secretion system inner membrane ring lipoprotein SctJ n=1 Tax=Roseateles sp. YR242 TaxID=1855305 RepID=UPI0008B91822|nr:type III secretion inner membrane ring lipoprotein SctJ [Roseateles sp. YR242]SEK51325.1 type III secretion protein J [Roseateles sp. YR242]
MKPLINRWLAVAAATVVLTACDARVELYGGLPERDANDITAALTDQGIDAQKESLGKQLFAVRVPKSDFSRSVALLQAEGLPRHSFTRMGDIFKKDGMISTPTEERARFLHALSQELESTLSGIDGVVQARVHPVLPERVVPGEPVLPSSCSVLIKHVPGWDTAAYEPRIRKLVLASIPGLAEAPEKVAVVFVPSEGLAVRDQALAYRAHSAANGKPPPAALGPTALAAAPGAVTPATSGAWQAWVIGITAMLIGIGGPSAWLWWHKRRAPAAPPPRRER